MGKKKFGIDKIYINRYAEEIKKIVNIGIQVAIVIGGGNFFRGLKINFINRIYGDYMGMMSTLINSIALKSFLENLGITVILQTPMSIGQISEKYNINKSIKYLKEGNVVIFPSGIGIPYFTTDTAAIIRGLEINADIILKGTKVDGVYNIDPIIYKNKYKKIYNNISFKKAYKIGLKFMDQTAFTLGHENNIKMIIFNINKKGNLKKIVCGEKIGTIIY